MAQQIPSQEHLMNGKVSSMNASKEASKINKCKHKSVNVSWFSLPPEHIFDFFFSRQAKSHAHKECKLFAFMVSGLGGILTACKNFPLKCKLLTSQSFHLFYLLMRNLNK